MKKKRLFKAALGVALATSFAFTLASCKGSSSEARNTITPYGDLYSNLDKTIATAKSAKGEDISLTLDKYYSRLRSNGYDLATRKINEIIYKDEFEAFKLMYSKDWEDLTQDEKNSLNDTLKLTDTLDEHSYSTQETLYEIDEVKFDELKSQLLININKAVGNAILGTTDADSAKKNTEDSFKKENYKKIYVDSVRTDGVDITVDDIEWVFPGEADYTLDENYNIVEFSKKTLEKLYDSIVRNELLTAARNYSSIKNLYKIADEEYIYNEDDDALKKNNNYIFKDTNLESKYNTTYKTYGTYRAIVIQFNSRKEAFDTINKVTEGQGISETDSTAALNTYLDIYKSYYSYKTSPDITVEDDTFKYTINKYKNDLEDLPSAISEIVTDTLDDEVKCLYTPRNINNKYVLVYKISSEYDHHDKDDVSKQLDYDDFDEADKALMEKKLKEDLLNSNATTYRSINENKLYDDATIKIYDPLFEYKFQYSYSDYYDLIEDKVENTSKNILTVNDVDYTVEEFYKEASAKYATSILSDFFQLEYAYEFYDEYVENFLIDDEDHDNNADTLKDAISTFNNNKNSTYPKKMGLENYLLAAYGYNNKDDIIKYYYDAKKALSVYKSMFVFDEWAKEQTNTEDDTTTYVIDESKLNILENILATGNTNYSKLFGINIDHFLIAIDDDSNGTPDDPAEFIINNPSLKEKFEDAVVELSKALYYEATLLNDKDEEILKNSSLFERLKYLKQQYEEGNDLIKPYTSDITGVTYTNWDEFKEFNFLITVEQLASSGDITNQSVSNFVIPFADYVKLVYKNISADVSDNTLTPDDVDGNKSSWTNGIFYAVNVNKDSTSYEDGFKVTSADQITIDTICKSSFGYHVLMVNSFNVPEDTQYTAEADDSEGFQAELQITLREWTDDDEEEHRIYVVTDSYNTNKTEASIKQLFIYYVQKNKSASSSLDSSIQSIMSELFDSVITTYTSDNFQTYLLLKKLNVQVADIEILGTKVSSDAINDKLTFFTNSICNYESDSIYLDWFADSTDWTRPNEK